MNKIAEEFYGLVMEWKDLFDSFSGKEWGVAEMAQIIPVLMRLYMTAMKLPEPEFTEEAEPLEIEWRHPPGAEEKYQYYQIVFDPYEYSGKGGRPDEPCWGDLNDDIFGISWDLFEGAEAYESGLVCLALVLWKCSFFHWGIHAVHALYAMESAYLYTEFLGEEKV